MIDFLTGDIFTSTAPAVGHGVNTHGLMGAGIAAVIRRKYPSVYQEYHKHCKSPGLKPGTMLPLLGEDGRWVFNIASQDRPGPHARLTWLESGVEEAFRFCEENEIPAFAIPRIGAGIGGLEWEDVRSTLVELSDLHPEVMLQVWTLPS